MAYMNSRITKELVFLHFSGKTSALQKQLIDEWAQVKANEEQYYRWLEEYEEMHPEYMADVDGAIDRYWTFLAANRNAPHRVEKDSEAAPARFWRRPFFYLIAAASVSLILVTFVVVQSELWQYRTFRTGFGKTASFQLPDGSLVTLNANSSLKVPRWRFGETSREVILDGEASFSVKHTTTHQKFIVHTARRFEVEVLGTEFTVFSRAREGRVVLNKGKVQLNLQKGETIQKMVMKPGDLVILDEKNQVLQKKIVQPEVPAVWAGHRYVFDQTSLQEIIYILKENYGLTAEVNDPQLLGLSVSGTLSAGSADALLELIETVLDLRTVRQGNKILISHPNP